MALGNRDVMSMPILPAPASGWVYTVKGSVDYRVQVGGTNGFAYTDGAGVLSSTIPVSYTQLIDVPSSFPPSTHNQGWNTITGTPTTVGGYGITDAYTKTQSDTNYPTKAGVGATGTWAIAISGNSATTTKLATPRAINGVPFDGSTDITLATAATTWGTISGTLSSQSDLNTALNSKPSTTGAGASGTWGINVTGSAGSVAWTNVSGRPVNVSAFTNDAGYITSMGTVTWGSITGKPTTKAGYGITDVPLYDGSGATGTWGISVTGSAGSAAAWSTARTLTIGNTGKSVNGGSDVSWSLAEIGIYVQASDPGSVPDGSLWVW